MSSPNEGGINISKINFMRLAKKERGIIQGNIVIYYMISKKMSMTLLMKMQKEFIMRLKRL